MHFDYSSRTISNHSNDKVIFLRISDAGDDESQNNADITVEKIDEQGTLTVIKEGFKKLVARRTEQS